MPSIDRIISELREIRNALTQEAGDPRRRPRHRGPTEAASSEQVRGDPIFDSGRWEITDQDRWREAQTGALRDVEQGHPPRTGIDALAWYVSFHHHQTDWGIYIPLSSLALMDELFFKQLPRPREHRLHLAWSILLKHEQMHFAIDHACAWFELMLRAPIRRQFTNRLSSPPPLPSLSLTEPYLGIEETAANAFMLRTLKQYENRRAIQAVEAFVEKQPEGYREGCKATDDATFAKVVAETLKSYLGLWAIEHRLDLGNPATDLSRLLPIHDDRVMADCPVHVLHDLDDVGVAPGSVHLLQSISAIVESQDFERQLQRQNDDIQRDWKRKREQLKGGLPAPPRFEKLKNWQPPTWSLRLRSGYRVHLQQPGPGTAAWRAVAIGNHKEMGHG